MINMCLDVNYQSSWEILITFLLELKNVTLSKFAYFVKLNLVLQMRKPFPEM